MTPQDTTTAYLRSKVMTASPEELRLMLLDGALRFAHQAAAGLESKNFELSYSGFTQCRAIILELNSSIDESKSPEIADRVKGLYNFLYTELIGASHEKDAGRVAKVIELLEYERETWAMLMERLEEERNGVQATTERQAISFQA